MNRLARTRVNFRLATKMLLYKSCVMDLIEGINSKLPEGRRPITSLSHPGDINKSVASIITTMVDPETVGAMLVEMMTATRMTKLGVEPDWRAREAGAKLYLAYKEGLPIQRQEIHQTIVNKSEEENMKTLQSPAMLAAMKNLIARVEGKDE